MNFNSVRQKTYTTFVLFGLVPLCLPSFALADNGDSAAAYRDGYNLILDEDWSGAIAAFEKLTQQHPHSEWTDDAAFWRCYGHQQNGASAVDSFACYETILDQHEGSEWNDDVRRALVRLARQLDQEGRSEYREKVSDFGRSADSDRTLSVLVALGDIGDERSLDVILERLDATSDEHLRARIVEILEDIESPRAVEKLKILIRTDPATRVRMVAIDALGNHEDADIPQLLMQLARDPSQPEPVRMEAIDALTDFTIPGLRAFLKELALGDSDAVAMEAIDEISDDDENSEATVQLLLEILRETAHERRRAEVLESLADVGTQSAVDALLRVAKADPDPRIRRMATEALGDMDTVAAREALIGLLKELDD